MGAEKEWRMSGWSAAELGMRLGNWIWRRGTLGAELWLFFKNRAGNKCCTNELAKAILVQSLTNETCQKKMSLMFFLSK